MNGADDFDSFLSARTNSHASLSSQSNIPLPSPSKPLTEQPAVADDFDSFLAARMQQMWEGTNQE
jgi:hypothetical protein